MSQGQGDRAAQSTRRASDKSDLAGEIEARIFCHGGSFEWFLRNEVMQ